MSKQIIEVEADSLKEAREQVKAQIPEGLHLLSEQVLSDGEPKTVKAVADTTESAFAKAQSEIPADATILEKKELSAPEQRVIAVQAFDERGAESEARLRLGGATVVKSLKLIVVGKKGFLGIRKMPNQYEAQVLEQAIVEITYKQKVKIRATIGEKKASREQKVRINRVEICFDSQLPPHISEQNAIEELVRYFDLPKSFTRDVHISTSYGKVPGVIESARTGECTPELKGFVLARAIVVGERCNTELNEMELGEIIPHLFNIAGILGVLIALNVKEPWLDSRKEV